MIPFELRIILVFLVSLFSVIFILPKIANIAKRIGLLDLPNARKMHTKARPLVGGIGMVIAVIFTSLVFIPINGLRGYFLGLAILVFVGFLDDFKELAHQQKFLAQIIATIAMIYFSKINLHTFGDLLGTGPVSLPAGNATIWIITIFCVVGVTNAVNLIDGLDGLAGGLSFIAFIFFAVHASFAGAHTLMLLNLTLAGAVLGFLKFNWYPSVLFMGDAGSLCLGFSLAFMALALTQGTNNITSPVTALLILAVPITDTIVVLFKRLLQRKSPFKPDKSHLHHIFLRYGMNRAQSVQVILAIGILLGSLSLLEPLYMIQEKWLFLLFAVYFFIYIAGSFYIVGLFKYSLRRRKNRQHLARSDLFSRFFYGAFDHFKLFRKKRRYNVYLAVQCTSKGSDLILHGHILNISQTGCMIKMPAFTDELITMTLSCELLADEKTINCTLGAEHLWVANHEGSSFHGFRFHALNREKATLLSNYLTTVAAQPHNYSKNKITA